MLIGKLARTFLEARKQNVAIDEEKLISLMGAEEGVARRTAQEYIKCAKEKMLLMENAE